MRYTYIVCVFTFLIREVVVVVSTEAGLRFGMMKSNIGVIDKAMTIKYGVYVPKNVV
jgi:sugar phosphate permease